MSEEIQTNPPDEYAKAKDLIVKVKFEADNTIEGHLRKKQAQEIICQLILLGQKRGRPSQQKEIEHEAA